MARTRLLKRCFRLYSGMFSLMPTMAAAQAATAEGEELSRYVFPVAGMIFVLIIIAMNLMAANRKERSRMELMARFIEAGQEIPPELLPPSPAAAARMEKERDIRRGIWLLGWGLGVGIALYVYTGEPRAAIWSLVFFFLSLACFINAVLSTKLAKDQTQQE